MDPLNSNCESVKLQQARLTRTNKADYKASYVEKITALVGDEDDQQAFTVHKGMICRKSDLFASAFSPDEADEQTKTMRLPQLRPQTFHLYLHLVYANAIDLTINEFPSDANDAGVKNRAETFALIELCIAAGILQDKSLINPVINALALKVGQSKFSLNDQALN